jgi:hypothetical protein
LDNIPGLIGADVLPFEYILHKTIFLYRMAVAVPGMGAPILSDCVEEAFSLNQFTGAFVNCE